MVQQVVPGDQLGEVFVWIGGRGHHDEVEHPGLRPQPPSQPGEEVGAHWCTGILAGETLEDLRLVDVGGDDGVGGEGHHGIGPSGRRRIDPDGSVGRRECAASGLSQQDRKGVGLDHNCNLAEAPGPFFPGAYRFAT